MDKIIKWNLLQFLIHKSNNTDKTFCGKQFLTYIPVCVTKRDGNRQALSESEVQSLCLTEDLVQILR